MAIVGCLQRIGFLQTTADSAAVPWRRKTGMCITPTYLYTYFCSIIYLLTYLQGRVHFLLPVGSPFPHCFCLPFLSPKVRAYQQPIHIRVNSTMMKRFEFQWVQPAFAFYSSFDVPILFVFISTVRCS